MRGGPWRRYLALGDSFTEGLVDPVDPDGADGADGHRGWADRLADLLDQGQRRDDPAAPALQYANLAVRGHLQRRILDEQLPRALAMHPDLVSLSAGGNDLLRPRPDVPAITARTEAAVVALRAAGADVLLVAGVDPRAAPLLRLTRSRVADHNQSVWAIAQRHGARVLDLWGLTALQDPRMWAQDRIHLSPEGHRRVAHLAEATLTGQGTGRGAAGTGGEPTGAPEWSTPLEPPPRRTRTALATASSDAAWVRRDLVPWVGRRLAGRSSGDGRTAKRPTWAPVGVTRATERTSPTSPGSGAPV